MVSAIAIVSALVASIAAGISWFYSHRSNALAKATLDHERKALEHAEATLKQGKQALRVEYQDGIRRWADRTTELVVQLVHTCKEHGAASSGELAALSAQIEKGRSFFPNVLSEELGLHKPRAYRGLRPPILDHLVDIYDAASATTAPGKQAQVSSLTAFQRQFVSEVQDILAPGRETDFYDDAADDFRALTEAFREGVGRGGESL